MAKKKKKSPVKRIGAALTGWLKRQNPAFKRAGTVRVTKLRGGGVTIRPNPAQPYDIHVKADGRWERVSVVYANSAAEAKMLARRGAWKRYQIKVTKG
jgi:hypothetical protein